MVDAVEQGYREAGEVLFETAPREGETQQRLRFSQRFECKQCNIRYEEPEPRLFSFNNPFGACPRCQGFGNTIDFDLNLVIPNKTLDAWPKERLSPGRSQSTSRSPPRCAALLGRPAFLWTFPGRTSTADQQSFIVKRRREVLGRARIL